MFSSVRNSELKGTPVLHVTNGDAAAGRIRALGLPGDLLPWRDVLHDGPVPRCADDSELRRVRARFLADCGWTRYEQALDGLESRDFQLGQALESTEVHLWFEPDLYDQLQLLQVLDLIRRTDGIAEVFLVSSDDFLAMASSEQLLAWNEARVRVTEAHLAIGTRVWDAFRASDPLELGRQATQNLQVLPYLGQALKRLIDEYPSVSDGLARSERQALAAIWSGDCTAEEAFRASAAREEFAYLGDGSFERYLVRLGAGATPLLRFADGSTIKGAEPDDPGRSFWRRRLTLTEHGSAVLDGSVNRETLLPLDRWIGGVHLSADTPRWRRDPDGDTLIVEQN